MARSADTIAAPATPAGTAALAVLRITGPDTTRLAAELLSGAPPPRIATHADYRDRRGELLDDALFTFYQGPRSYTGEDALEISCHGNPFIVQKILEDLFARGCRPAEAGEFTQRAFLNGRIDLSQAEAVMDVIQARGERALAAAQQQLRGALGRRLRGLVDELLDAQARVEAYIDFPDEDLPAEDRSLVRRAAESALAGTKRLLATGRYGELLREGVRTVIVGEPNAGKSSLLNRLVGSERALVSPEPGTTRDFIEERLMAGAYALRLIDTAGLNPNAEGVEKQGIERTFEQAERADLILWVLDCSRPAPPMESGLRARLTPANTIVALNKIDLLAAGSGRRREPVAAPPSGFAVVELSALTGEGREALIAAITRLADGFQVAGGEDLISINARHAFALELARACAESALRHLAENGPTELLASDLRGALEAIGEIAGRVDNERMLDRLFATFCIGK